MDSDFWEEYAARANQVQMAGYKTFQDRIARWLGVLDGDGNVVRVLSALEAAFDFKKWFAEVSEPRGSMIGSAELKWPKNEDGRIAAHLGLCRQWASEEDAAIDFGLNFFGATKYDEGIREIQTEVFMPFVDDLERYFRRQIRSVEQPKSVPASDRVVALSHNSDAVAAAIHNLEALIQALRETNDYDDTDDKEQRLAELRAGEALLKAPKTRLAAVREVLFKCLKYLGEKFADHAIGAVISAVFTALAAIFGIHALL